MNKEDERQPGDERFERTTSRALREAAEDLDASTLSRLNQARQRALAELDGGRMRRGWLTYGWQPALGAAAVALLAVALWIGRDGANDPPVTTAPPGADAAELEVLLDDENLELIENLDFYEWLEADLTTPTESRLPGGADRTAASAELLT